jgi:cytoskeletal protein RodZ
MISIMLWNMVLFVDTVSVANADTQKTAPLPVQTPTATNTSISTPSSVNTPTISETSIPTPMQSFTPTLTSAGGTDKITIPQRVDAGTTTSELGSGHLCAGDHGELFGYRWM